MGERIFNKNIAEKLGVNRRIVMQVLTNSTKRRIISNDTNGEYFSEDCQM